MASSLSSLRLYFVIFSVTCFYLVVVVQEVDAARNKKKKQQKMDLETVRNLDYIEFPRRTQDEAAVLEWGHSAIISALDASVATFGPQTSQAALLEVECKPVLGEPLNGIFDDDEDAEEGGEKEKKAVIRPLDNADDVHGNMVVMTNTGNISGVQMAKIAKASGAAALLIVNIDEERPDDIYRLQVDPEVDTEEDVNHVVDLPVVMISMNSANVFTSATVTPETQASEIINHGMPERVRLYAGGDRPFFEDVEPVDPTLYLIHNLLTSEECDALVNSAKTLVRPVTEKDDPLQLSFGGNSLDTYVNGVERVMLWSGLLLTPAKKAIEERIEQVTGFPSKHYSDFIVDKLDPTTGAVWNPHYDTYPGLIPPMATITIFLTDHEETSHDNNDTTPSNCMLYPMCREPVLIHGRKGMAVVHHNTNEHNQMDPNTLHALLTTKKQNKPIYIARKYVFGIPDGMARKLALPIFAIPFGGRLPDFIVAIHDFIVSNVASGDLELGGSYFDKLCVFFPLLIILGIAQIIGDKIHQGFKQQQQQQLEKQQQKDKEQQLKKQKKKKGKAD